MYQASVRSTTAGTGKTVLAIVASLSLLLSLFAAALPAAAEDGTGQADCPEGTIFLDNFDQGDINVGDELVAGVFVTAVTRTDGETGELTSVTIENTTSSTITIAVKGGSDQVGNSVTIEAGGEETITVTNNPTISNLSVCQGPVSPTLTVAKATIGGDDDFQFQLDGSNAAVLSNGESEEVATTSGEFDLTEVLSQEQIDAGWALTGVDCTGNAAEEADIAGGVTVTVGADEDVICTFTNTLTPPPTPSLTVAKETVGGDDDFQFTLDDVNAALLSDGESDEVATMSGTFDLAEVLSQEQIDAGWALTAVDCSGNATEESDISGGVEVTVGADEDVVCTFTNTLTPPPPPPGEGFLEVDKLICLAETSSTTFDVDMVEVQSFALEDIGDCMFGAGVTFSVFVDANGNGELDEGEVLSDDEDLVDGTLTTNENGSITVDLPEGDYILVEEAGGNEQGTWPGGSVAFSIEDGVFTIIEVTNNIAEEEENGFLKIRKFFCDTAAPEGFDNPHFIELEGPEADTDASLPDQFAENCTRGGDNPEATFEIDGREFITDDGILVVSLPAGEHDVVETDPNEGSTTVTVEVDGTTSLLVLNFLPEQEQLGSITVQKEIECEVCETFTPGFFFNQGENNEGTAFAEDSLSNDPITVDGMTFDSVQSVQDGTDPGSLLRHYLALVLNTRLGDANDCDLLAVTYSGSMEAFVGMTIGEILDEAETVLNGGSSEFTEEQLHDVIDEINNADVGDDTLTCSDSTGLAGFDFVLTDEEDMEHTGTTNAEGTIVFDDLPLGTYTLEETGGPDGSDCTVVSASGDGVEFDAETGVITITLTAEMADVTVTVVNDCGGQSGEQFGSITILKNAVPDDDQDFAFTTTGSGLSGFSLDDDADATLSNQKVFTSLGAGTYSVTEAATDGWDLTSITCSAGGTADMANRTANITLAEGADVTCTFVNTQQGQQAELGSITILKNAVPDDAQDFAFTTTGTGLSGFSLDDDADATLSNQKTFTGLGAGMYTVAEGSVNGWVLASLTCSPSAAVTVTGSTASINLAAGANVTCTFVNNRSGSGTLPNQGGPTVTPRQGTLAGNLPNTATEPFTGTSLPVAVVALLMLSGLGAAAYAMKAEASRRR